MDIRKLVQSFQMVLLLNGMVSLAWADSNLVSLSDEELAVETGQALLNMSHIAPTDASNTMSSANNISFYKLGMEAELEINANIRNLQLGCGGVNGAGACDIDIQNLAISGAPDRYDSNGNPIFDNGRASTSAKLTNPFIEFAIKNSNSASTREVLGFRTSAEKMAGLLTLGTQNTNNPADGIRNLSGYMQIAPTSGVATTQQALFGKTNDQTIAGLLNINTLWSNLRSFTSLPNDSRTTGLVIPSMNVPFNIPAFPVNGKRRTTAYVDGITANVPSIALNRDSGSLRVKLDRNLLWVVESTFYMGAGTSIDNLKMNITFSQALSMIHNIPLSGTGGYLSLQKQNLRWPGTNVDDVAQTGWWMSFKDPVQLGTLNIQEQVDISSVLPQVAQKVTDFLMQEKNRIAIPFGSALGAAIGLPIEKNIGSINLSDATPASLNLSNQILKNQVVPRNCYGGLTFC